MIERKISRFGVLFLIFLLPLCALAQMSDKIQTIVIDPGHGGKDTGALGSVTKEKDLNLAIALKFGAYIEENLPDVKVVYTRNTDKFIKLDERPAIANRNNADVFISIHCNSTDGATAYGAETYIMGESKNEKNLAVAKKENAAILLEDNTDAYNNFDPNSSEAYILFSLSQSVYQQQSLNLANKVQQQLVNKVGRHDRGVQQGEFLVLWGTAMPSILVELGFINNVKEEQFLNSEKGQTQLALALYRAFEEYKREFEAENHATAQPMEEAQPTVVGDTYFTVQFASRTKQVASTEKAFSGVKEVDVYEYNGAFRYISGHFTSKAEATKRQTELRAMGYNDAFVVAFVNGERSTIKQAEEALKK